MDILTPIIHTVNEQYRRYCKDKNAYSELKRAVDIYVYRYPISISWRYEELCGDFWSIMSHKIPKYITTFVYSTTPFERYLYITLKYQFITFLHNLIRHTKEVRMYSNEHALFCLDSSNTVCAENVEDYIFSVPDSLIQTHDCMDIVIQFFHEIIHKNTANNRLWWFILHCSPLIPDERIYDMGYKLGVLENDIRHTLRELSSVIEMKRTQLQALETRCNIYFSKRNSLDRMLEEDVLVQQEEYEIKARREICNKRYHRIFDQLQNITCTISHAKLSKVLGVPKGTIDSGIALLKKQCIKLKDKAHEKGIL